jgi:hypothetical protein
VNPTSAPISTPPEANLSIEQVSVPITGVEGFLLAANDSGLFAGASVPNPGVWDERVWRSTDSGASWQEVLSVTGEGIVVDLVGAGEEIDVLVSGHVVEGPSYVYRSRDGGETWTRLELPTPDGAVGVLATSIAVGDSTVVIGESWNGVVEESFNDGAVLSSTPAGVRALAWRLNGDALEAPVQIAANGEVRDLAWTGSAYVAVGLGEVSSNRPGIWMSSDGVAWHAGRVPDIPRGVTTDGLKAIVVSGNGGVIALADIAGATNVDTLLYVMSDSGEWSLVQLDGYRFVGAVGMAWGFVATAPLSNGVGVAVVSSHDGETWEAGSRTDAYFARGVATPSGAFVTGVSVNGDSMDAGASGIWRLTTP